MDTVTLNKVVANVHRRYPEFAGVKPQVRKQQTGKDQPKPQETTYTLTFKKTVHTDTLAGSRTIPKLMRITVNERGAILKVSTSR